MSDDDLMHKFRANCAHGGATPAQAEALAQRVAAAFPGNMVARISLAHKLLYGREATAAETSEAVVYLAGFRARLPTEQTPTEREASAWTSYARALMGANEFIFLD